MFNWKNASVVRLGISRTPPHSGHRTHKLIARFSFFLLSRSWLKNSTIFSFAKSPWSRWQHAAWDVRSIHRNKSNFEWFRAFKSRRKWNMNEVFEIEKFDTYSMQICEICKSSWISDRCRPSNRKPRKTVYQVNDESMTGPPSYGSLFKKFRIWICIEY